MTGQPWKLCPWFDFPNTVIQCCLRESKKSCETPTWAGAVSYKRSDGGHKSWGISEVSKRYLRGSGLPHLSNWVPSVCHKKKTLKLKPEFITEQACSGGDLHFFNLDWFHLELSFKMAWENGYQTFLPFSQTSNKGRCYWGIGNTMVKFPRETHVQGSA